MTLKSNLSNKKGMSLIETIAAMLLASLVVAMLGSLTVTTVKTYSLITAESNMQTEAIIASRKLLAEIGNFGPKDVASCGDNCLLFNERDEISFDDNNNAVVVPGTEFLTIKIEDNMLYSDDTALISSIYFVKDLSNDEGLTYHCISSGCTDAIITLKITLVNVRHELEYQFTTSFPI